MEGVEEKIGNTCHPIYDNTVLENVYFSDFGDDDGVDDPPFPYEDEIINA